MRETHYAPCAFFALCVHTLQKVRLYGKQAEASHVCQVSLVQSPVSGVRCPGSSGLAWPGLAWDSPVPVSFLVPPQRGGGDKFTPAWSRASVLLDISGICPEASCAGSFILRTTSKVTLHIEKYWFKLFWFRYENIHLKHV